MCQALLDARNILVHVASGFELQQSFALIDLILIPVFLEFSFYA